MSTTCVRYHQPIIIQYKSEMNAIEKGIKAESLEKSVWLSVF